MSVQAGGETRCGIGTRLRAGRERKSMTVLQAAEKLHVDAKILESLESEDFASLGAPVYVRGHMRHYAELVGESPAELVALYSNIALAAQPDLTRIPQAHPSSDPRSLLIPAVAVITGFAIAGAVWWVLSLPKAHPGAAQKQTLAQTQPATQPAPEPSAAAPPSAPAPVAQSPTSAQAIPTSLGATHPASAEAETAPRPKQSELTLRFTGESWAEVYDSTGQRLFYDIGSANSVRSFKGVAPLRVVLGNAPGVGVEINGHTTDIATVTHADGSAQFVVNRAGHASQPKP